MAPHWPPFPDRKFSVIYCDPPWDYGGQRQHGGEGTADTGGAEAHYPTVDLAMLKALPVWNLAQENCLLFMWATSPHLDQALDLLKAWGFAWATVGFVWDKQRTNPGFYTLSQCELVLIGKRGVIPTPRGSRNERQFVSQLRGEHSEKPDEVRDRIAAMFPELPKIELFARVVRPGWTCWGNEVSEGRPTPLKTEPESAELRSDFKDLMGF